LSFRCYSPIGVRGKRRGSFTLTNFRRGVIGGKSEERGHEYDNLLLVEEGKGKGNVTT